MQKKNNYCKLGPLIGVFICINLSCTIFILIWKIGIVSPLFKKRKLRLNQNSTPGLPLNYISRYAIKKTFSIILIKTPGYIELDEKQRNSWAEKIRTELCQEEMSDKRKQIMDDHVPLGYLSYHNPFMSYFASVFSYFKWQKWQMSFKIFFMKIIYGNAM